eukprot:NODE_27000_length_529_cov_3.738806.p1 GENE.NODE_27000_length_529_cov_3.738806~~NODE_27000_length_529_cov_3.738806.p1  ORF type:complete len:73 (-),score=10.18 NODE_27000_length_529_cov_3.738806:264-482(-)
MPTASTARRTLGKPKPAMPKTSTPECSHEARHACRAPRVVAPRCARAGQRDCRSARLMLGAWLSCRSRLLRH